MKKNEKKLTLGKLSEQLWNVVKVFRIGSEGLAELSETECCLVANV